LSLYTLSIEDRALNIPANTPPHKVASRNGAWKKFLYWATLSGK
jgi:hypothetical protein